MAPVLPSVAAVDSGMPVNPVPPTTPEPQDWRSLGGGRVNPGQSSTIQAGRYGLVVDAGTVDRLTDFSVADYDSSVLDVELGPHGQMFMKPVQFFVSYAGTNADPDCPGYDGSEPQVVWYNEDSGAWVPVPGDVDPKLKTIVVRLSHFSRYAIQKASW